ncbi:YdeI/OmpD-associated family protein [Candidatus Saccharibacteria bacterium]|nr:YdeI/OmpD-associated family protein [Candidatus Saccharibacteria bacterium]
MTKNIEAGVVHDLPKDLRVVLLSEETALERWNCLTPLARNEFLCWIENAKQEKTRAKRIRRTIEELLEGQKRPCCWVGCIHRTDKKPSKWQQDVLIDQKPKPAST